MATSQAAYAAERAIGHDDSAITQQDVADYKETGAQGETMKALTWQGKNKVQISTTSRLPTRLSSTTHYF